MPSPAELRRQYEALLDTYGPEVAAGFQESVDEIKSQIVVKRVVERLLAGDIEGALMAMNIEASAFAPLQDAILRAYTAGGTWSAKLFPRLPDQNGATVVIRFDVRNPRAEQWLRAESSRLVTEIVDDQREVIRGKLVEGLAAGRNPNATALDVVGRVSRVTGKREGGVMGLDRSRINASESYRARLLSGDPAEMRKIIGIGVDGQKIAEGGMKNRDKSFDRAVKKYIAAGKPVPAADVERMLQRYRDISLRKRGESIGRTETLSALNAAEDEAFRQGLDKTNYTEQDVIRVWDSAGDRKVRHTHAILDGKESAGLDIPFQSQSGALMRFPGDRSLGAPASEIINCRCRVRRRIDFFGGRV